MADIIVALDGMSWLESLHLARTLKGKVWGFKVNDLILEMGVGYILKLQKHGKIMADPKLLDIPNTVSNGVKRLMDSGASIITVHTMGGKKMLDAAVKAAGSTCVIAGVTVLTSLTTEELQATIFQPRHAMIKHLAKIAYDTGCGALVCGPSDLCLVKEVCPPDFNCIVPSIRPSGAVKNEDQAQSSATIPEGAAYIVVGRAVTQAADPAAVIKSLTTKVE